MWRNLENEKVACFAGNCVSLKTLPSSVFPAFLHEFFYWEAGRMRVHISCEGVVLYKAVTTVLYTFSAEHSVCKSCVTVTFRKRIMEFVTSYIVRREVFVKGASFGIAQSPKPVCHACICRHDVCQFVSPSIYLIGPTEIEQTAAFCIDGQAVSCESFKFPGRFRTFKHFCIKFRIATSKVYSIHIRNFSSHRAKKYNLSSVIFEGVEHILVIKTEGRVPGNPYPDICFWPLQVSNFRNRTGFGKFEHCIEVNVFLNKRCHFFSVVILFMGHI